MTERPRVTIGMPVFNGQNYVINAIESLLAQSFANFELTISDNASTDRTKEVCEHYAALDSRINYVRQDSNLGAIANFNLLAKLARGSYFKWAAHDDVCEPTYLQRCVEVLDEYPEVVLCHCDSDMIDEDGRSWLDRMPVDDEEIELDANGKRRWAGLPRYHHNASRPSQRFAGVLIGTRWCVDSYGLIRMNALRKTGLFPAIYGSEKVLIGELSLLGTTHQVSQELFKQRIHTAASAYQDDAAALQQFVGARNTMPFASTRMALLRAHIAVVRRSRVSAWEKSCCYAAVLKYALQYRKWIRVARRFLDRKGIGGGGRRIIEVGTRNVTRRTREAQA